jgi:RimJ/RimL family protein N-acetyltransferase
MILRFRDATLGDVPAIAALQNAASGALTARFGAGPWSTLVTEREAAFARRHARVRVGREGKRILTVVRLAARKPWAIDVSYFTPVKRPLYLTGMAVSVAHQGRGLGTRALEDACRVAVDGLRAPCVSMPLTRKPGREGSMSAGGSPSVAGWSTRATH